jgi:hypothetical protein
LRTLWDVFWNFGGLKIVTESRIREREYRIMPCAQVRRERIFQNKKIGRATAEQTKKKIDDDSLVFCIFLPHTPPFSLFLRRYRFRTPEKQAAALGNLRNIFGAHLQPQNSISFYYPTYAFHTARGCCSIRAVREHQWWGFQPWMLV